MHSDSFPHTRSGVIKGIIRSPLFKDILRTNLNEVNPHTGSSFVKTLMGEDPEVFFSLISSLPVFINVLIKASTEFAVQLKDKYPPEMLKAFLTSLYDDIDKDALRQCGKAWTELASSQWKTSPELRQAATGFLLSSGPKIKAGAINGLARFINAITQNNPQAFSIFIASVLRNIDGKEVGKATHTLAGAFLDQKWHLTSWTWNLVRNRVKKRFGKI
ncbi:MAG: hypothetical protein ACLQDF_11285 [Desulfomonilia bacterium]